MEYNLDFDIGAIFIWLFMIYCIYYKKGLRKTSNRIFMAIVVTGFVSAVSDTIGSWGNIYIFENGYSFLDIWNYLFLISHNVMPYLFVMYIIFLMGINYKINNTIFLVISLPMISSVLLLVTNPFTHLVYYFGKHNEYTHASMIQLLYFNAFLYVFIAMLLIMRFKNAISIEKVRPFIVFIIISVLPIIVQIFYPTILLELFFQSLGILGIMISIENEDELINSITHIYNRYGLLNDADMAIKTENYSVILTVKIPNTSYYNTTFGIRQMNGILRQIAKWLDLLDQNMNCYDCENGHFALMTYKHSLEEVKVIADQIKERFNEEWSYHNIQIGFPAQLCIIDISNKNATIEQLMMIIDAPFETTSSETEFIESYEFGDFHREMMIEKIIKDALKNKSFQVWYQPIWNRECNGIHSAEALIRLKDEQLGYISPDEFIPIAEKNGSIIKIGEYVFEEVCRLYTENKLYELGIEFIEVNLSVVQCMNKKLGESFSRILEKYNLDASHINLEITESAAASNQRTLIDSVVELNNLGFTFSLDDYGTGYSNFSYMLGMPFSIIKLDRSILWSAMNPKTGMQDENAMMFLESTMHMMRRMNYKIVVEGVETIEQKKVLEEFRCDYIQGFYFSKPVPEDIFIDYVKQANAAI